MQLAIITLAAQGTQMNLPAEVPVVHAASGAFPGAALNAAAKTAAAQWLLFLAADMRPAPGFFAALAAATQNAAPDVAALACRMLPYDDAPHMNPITLEMPYCTRCALAVRAEAFTAAGGFDTKLHLLWQTELSLRLRLAGGKVCFAPQAAVTCENRAAEETPATYLALQRETLLLAYKYTSFGGIIAANKAFLRTAKAPRHFDGVRKALAKAYLRHFIDLWHFTAARKGGHIEQRLPELADPKMHYARRAAMVAPLPENAPRISVVVRTCARPQSLRKTLQSLRNQTYKNFEVVVAEDGEDTARAMLEAEFADLPLVYHANGVRTGRGKNGNTGLRLASGEYCLFLDDDDFFYPDHLELLAAKAAQHPAADLVLGSAFVLKADVADKATHTLAVRALHSMHFDRVDYFTMCQTCQIPIQSAMFKKSLFEAYGGLREDMEANEDWAMWMTYLAHGTRIDPRHVDIDRETSIFVLPADESLAQQRIAYYKPFNEQFFSDPTICRTMTMHELRQVYDDMLADVAHVQQLGQLDAFLARERKRNE